MLADLALQTTIAAVLVVVGLLYNVPLLRGNGVPRD